ncbi:hypothetical protein PMM47T1_19878 [Pseudomonas sp. M47T1]|uniref:hypothetical protein n=1 Tax=Pseudomonas sp. M47T1 TaxID=1179778 RepID=UPI00026072D4|nr:hypothetical protein [Pseudomonas sp. M47T1]EIK94790.1 hypothetical protein PMM47T1_19878 [Pseudomonas sp. M47T1]
MKRWRAVSGMLAALLLLVAGLWHPQAALGATLAGALVWVNLALGCLLLAYVCPLISGAWQPMLAPGIAMGSGWVPWIVPLLLPMVLGVHWLYPWAQMPGSGFRGLWLSPWFFVLRTLLYGVAWWGLLRLARRPAPGVIALVLLASLAAIDWLMSLQTGLDSSIFGLLVVGRQLLGALALAGLVRAPGTPAAVLRGLLVAALALWLYLHFMQYLITDWTRLPAETLWYRLRGTGVWAPVTALLFGLHLACLVVLASPLGLRPPVLNGACWLILLLGAVEALWLVLPGLGGLDALGLGLLGVWAYAAVAGTWLVRRRADHE